MKVRVHATNNGLMVLDGILPVDTQSVTRVLSLPWTYVVACSNTSYHLDLTFIGRSMIALNKYFEKNRGAGKFRLFVRASSLWAAKNEGEA